MKKCIIIPDSFKGTMTSMEVCSIMGAAVKKRFPACEVLEIPVADGGEGTVDCFLRAGSGEKIYVSAQNAYGEEITGFYGRFGETAVIEMAAVAGMVSNARRDPLLASTYGVGQLISHAIAHGAREILIGLGGSCTSDAGCGMAAALGVRFYDEDGSAFIPAGGTLSRVKKIDDSLLREKLDGIRVSCMCDTNKVMYGPDGAAFVYGPQKGADPEEVRLLDLGLRQLSGVIRSELGVDVSQLKGGGAAGAMGAGAAAFMGADLRPGIEIIMDTVGFDRCLEGAGCVFTGEGSFDAQSLSGKAVIGIARRAARRGVPVIVVAGRNLSGASKLPEYGITAVFETAQSSDFEEIKRTCREDLAAAMNLALDYAERALAHR